MQSLTFYQDTGSPQQAVINRAQACKGPSHEDIRDAVRSWAGVDGQDVVSALIIEEYQAQGGDEITFPDDLSRQRQKLFRFSGGPGTGKNHLAAAIGNHLLSGGQSVLVVTIPDLMLRVRECYDGGQSEASLLDDLCKVDLLVLDEVGIQRGSNGEKVILNQVIDRRLSSMRPVGVLTNLNHDELLGALGARVIDRLQMDGGMWVNFDWGSYRKNVSHLRIVK